MLNDKFNSALFIIEEHNEAIGSEAEADGYVNPKGFIKCIKAAGGTSEDRLKRFSYEDILECLPETDGKKPKILAKDLANVFRGKDEPKDSGHQPRPVTSRKAERMTIQELCAHFDPEEPTNPVGKRLSDISRGEPFIVFETGRVVDVSTTTKLLMELKSGYPKGRETIEVGGKIKKVYHIGYLPEHYADENPLYKGRPLRQDGTCDQLNRSWEGVSKTIRQFVRVALDMGVFNVTGKQGREMAHDILDMALAADALTKLRARYPDVSVKFDELEENQDLPHLQIPLGIPVGNEEGRSDVPFSGLDEGKQVVWTVPQPAMTVHRGGTYSHYIAKRSPGNPW